MANNHLVVGLLAHVDAGKTTLAESILYSCGAMRTLGRVDHRDTILDHYELERARGITIFCKQAQIEWEGLCVSLLDTPGHVDFSAEMERTLQVLDYAVLIVSGADGVQGHTQTLWRLLKRYQIPVFLFVNKMDQPGTDKERLLRELQSRLDENCVEFGVSAEQKEGFGEELSMCAEDLLEEYLEKGNLSRESIAKAVSGRKLFPCYFGSALKLAGVDELLSGIRRYTLLPRYGQEFAARVFKIARDGAGMRLTYLKVTGGVLRVKMPVSNAGSAGSAESWEEKADQLRIYTGGQYRTVEEAGAGSICAVTGLTRTFAGQGLGAETENELPVLEPVLTYRVVLPEGCDAAKMLGQLRLLEEEDPQLHIVWKEALSEIHVQVMGEVQTEILKSEIRERFGTEVAFDCGSIVYKETIAAPVVGIGHFEPLRHYAEVHLLLEPGERGSGMQFASQCSEDVLDRNWQRLVLTHLEEKIHPGVLTGSEITDMRITLIAGRAHQKHTEGGDFRQAVYRAVRQGLRRGQSVLLEPYFSFALEVPVQCLGRAMSDIQRMYGSFEPPETVGEMSILRGTAPAEAMQDYQREVNAYTGGHGRLSCILKGYEPCHNPEEVIEKIHYDCDGDVNNPAGSVFCAHGAGFVVSWDKVEEYAHVQNGWKPDLLDKDSVMGENCMLGLASPYKKENRAGENYSGMGNPRDYITQEEIEAIFQQTYGKKPEDAGRYRRFHRTGGSSTAKQAAGKQEAVGETANCGETARQGSRFQKDRYLLVDGYNIIFAWEELRELAAVNIDGARDRLMDMMSNYQGYLGYPLILVFDAYKVKGNPGSVQQYHNIYVVYTKEAETADQYIEKTVHEIGRKNHVTVATSDALEQMIIWGDGAVRLSAQGLLEAVEQAGKEMQEKYLDQFDGPLFSKVCIQSDLK